MEALCGKSVSKSVVLIRTKRLNHIVKQKRYCSLKETVHEFLMLDVLDLKNRENHHAI